MRAVSVLTWVVFERQVPGKPKVTIVCDQAEWDLIQETQPNDCVLLRAGIVSEGEAEQLARSVAMPPKAPPVVGMKSPPSRPAGTAQTKAMTTWWYRSQRLAKGPYG